MAATPETAGNVPPGRSFKDFAHLFLSRAPAPGEVRAGPPAEPSDPPARMPAAAHGSPAPRPRPAREARLVLFLDGGEGWLRSFLAAELALLLAGEGGRVQLFEEGGLFPTASSHLGRVLGPGGAGRRLSIAQGEPTPAASAAADLCLVEIPAWLPAWAWPLLARADLRILVAGKDPLSRLRAFQQWKRVSAAGGGPTGLILAEAPGSGRARLAFRRFQVTAPAQAAGGLLFLGALPVEPALERIILPERKPAQVYFPGSLTAAALAGLAAAIRRILAPEMVGS